MSHTPPMEGWLRPDPQETQDLARQFEGLAARGIGGYTTVASGSKSDKGDATNPHIRLECKYRLGRPGPDGWLFPLQLIWLETIAVYAADKDQLPMLCCMWGDGSRRALIPAESLVARRYLDAHVPRSTVLPGREVQLPAPLPQGLPELLEFPNARCMDRTWLSAAFEDLPELAQLAAEARPDQVDDRPCGFRKPNRVGSGGRGGGGFGSGGGFKSNSGGGFGKGGFRK